MLVETPERRESEGSTLHAGRGKLVDERRCVKNFRSIHLPRGGTAVAELESAAASRGY